MYLGKFKQFVPFFAKNGTIHCKVIGRRRYSRGIPQGGLEIPCRLTFEGPRKYTDMLSSKIMRLRSTTDKPTSDDRKETELTAKVVQKFGDVEDEPPSGTLKANKQSEAITKVVDLTQESKQPKLCCIWEDGEASISWEADKSTEWVQIFNFTLKLADKTLLMTGKELTDMHINAALKLLLYQFPSFQGLHKILGQRHIGFWVNNYIQIWHSRQCHWITMSSVGCKTGEINVYDSLYSDLDEVTKCKVQRVLGSFTGITFNFPNVQRQVWDLLIVGYLL